MNAPGDFSNLGFSKHEEKMLSEAYGAVDNVPYAWDVLSDSNIPGAGGFMFCSDRRMDPISDAVGKADTCGHSGSSYGWTMRMMQHIAKYGWKSFVFTHTDPAKISFS